MNTTVYCRISSVGQLSGFSLDVQLDECKRALVANNISDAVVVQEVHSAYEEIPPLLQELIRKRKHRMVFYAVDRFSRNVIKGIESAQTLINNKCVLIFIRERLMVDSTNGKEWLKLVQLLTQAEAESKAISNRVKSVVAYLKRSGYHTSGRVPFGFSVSPDAIIPKRKRLHPNHQESDVMKFITLCRTKGATIDSINQALDRAVPGAIADPIVIEWKDKDKTIKLEALKYEMSYQDITYFLNEYGILYRGKRWTINLVQSVGRRSQKSAENNLLELDKEFSLFGFDEMKYDVSHSAPEKVVSTPLIVPENNTHFRHHKLRNLPRLNYKE
jgi:DNA invertase Pin-like site-specific DNA recombinase